MNRLAIAIVCLVAVMGCEDGHRHDGHADEGTAGVPGLTMNNGQKWQMDAHTRKMFTEMTQRVRSNSEDPKQLGAGLKDDLKKLVNGCTMTGKAHDELHEFLIHYMPAVSKLSESGSDEALQRVTSLLDAYPAYFE